ncbi:MAG: tetratricopeptide repeat protein, partial [Lachnospiraceae bacterium]|nr:tetratricopeptide repeat protein [Lachnospiraceae bacterium]
VIFIVSVATGRKVKRRDVKKTDFTEIKDPNPLVIQGEQKSSLTDFNTGRFSLINLLIGIIVGAAAIGLLLIPSIKKTEAQRYNNAVADYSSIITSRNRTIANLNARISDMEEEMALMRSQMEQYASYTDEGTNDDLLLQAAKEYLNGNLRGAGEILSEIERDKLDHTSSVDVYEFLVNECRDTIVDNMYVDALTNYRNGLYTDALDGFRKVLNLAPDYADAVFYRAMTYYELADRTNARKYLEEFIERFPNNSHVGEANEILRTMQE